VECLQIIVKIKLYDIIDVLQQKGHELDNLISLRGDYAIFAGDSTFSWKWLALNLPYTNEWCDADCIEFHQDNVVIVAALWQHEGSQALTQWYLSNGCSDDFIKDTKVNEILADVQKQTEVTNFCFDRQKWLNARAQAKSEPVAKK
jgi:hypothetical protein